MTKSLLCMLPKNNFHYIGDLKQCRTNWAGTRKQGASMSTLSDIKNGVFLQIDSCDLTEDMYDISCLTSTLEKHMNS